MDSSEYASLTNNRLPITDMNHNLLSLLPVAIYTCDIDGKITYFNEAAAELWGRRPEIGKDYWCGSFKIFTPDGLPMLLESCPMAVALRERRPVMGEEILVERPDGVRVNIQPNPQPIYDAHGIMVGAINMLVDITDKKKKDAAVRESENKYKQLSESLELVVAHRTGKLKKSEERYHKMVEEVQDYAILLLDENGTIINWNKGAEKIKGYSESEIVGKNFRIFYLPQDQEENLPQKLIDEAAKNGRAMHEGWRVRKDGTKFWGYIVITALHDESGELIGFSKVTRDLTERKIAEDLLKDNARDIEMRNKQLEEFAYIASHDLQEPLRKILTFGDILKMKIDDREAVIANVEKINAAANRMSLLIKDVLKYSQLSGTEMVIEEVDLNNIFKEVVADFELLIAEKNATVTATKLPVVKAIPIQMHQLFSNMISNSIKFSEGNPVIEISTEYITPSNNSGYELPNPLGNYIKLSFKDNGPGFEQQYANHVFKLFKRLGGGQGGTGIGLALCKKIAENHNGAITVKSEPGKGATFEVLLPV